MQHEVTGSEVEITVLGRMQPYRGFEFPGSDFIVVGFQQQEPRSKMFQSQVLVIFPGMDRRGDYTETNDP
jgi:hypothetical protein